MRLNYDDQYTTSLYITIAAFACAADLHGIQCSRLHHTKTWSTSSNTQIQNAGITNALPSLAFPGNTCLLSSPGLLSHAGIDHCQVEGDEHKLGKPQGQCALCLPDAVGFVPPVCFLADLYSMHLSVTASNGFNHFVFRTCKTPGVQPGQETIATGCRSVTESVLRLQQS